MDDKLKEEMKQIGLTGGEQMVALGIEVAIKLITAIVKDTENTIDDAALAFVNETLIPQLYKQVDRIDGIEGNLE